MLPFTSHPDTDTIELHVMNRIENEALDEHMLVCPHCQQAAENLAEEIGLLRLAFSA